MNTSWFLIANPIAGNGKFSKRWDKIKKALKTNNIPFSFAFTKHSKHEVELVQIAIQQGFRKIISVGGDGTLHNVVNGIMTQRYTKTSNITVAVIPIGTGNDWVKTYNIPKNIEKAVDLIQQKKTVFQDIGFLELSDGKSAYFNNVAGLGYDGYVVNKTNKLKRFGSIAYLLGGIAGLFFYKNSTFKIELENETLETKCLMALFGICKYSGGGMQLTNYKNASDGLFDITVAKNLTLLDLLLNLGKLYSGKIVNHKKVTTYTSKKLKITPLSSDKPFIQADGELIGKGTIEVSLLEKAILFIVS